jgi:hypothetical protein
MLDEMTRLALASLSRHSPAGFYLMVEGASIDKRAHAVDAERTVWDTIEFDNAVRVALDFAARTNGDDDPDNDTLVIVTADHECGGLAIIGVGNERYAPARLAGPCATTRPSSGSSPSRSCRSCPNYEPDERGYPRDPDPSRKLLLGWAAGPDRYENWLSNRLMLDAAMVEKSADGLPVAVANPKRDGQAAVSDNRAVGGQPIPGFLVSGSSRTAQHPARRGRLSGRHRGPSPTRLPVTRPPTCRSRPWSRRVAVHRHLREQRRLRQAAAQRDGLLRGARRPLARARAGTRGATRWPSRDRPGTRRALCPGGAGGAWRRRRDARRRSPRPGPGPPPVSRGFFGAGRRDWPGPRMVRRCGRPAAVAARRESRP